MTYLQPAILIIDDEFLILKALEQTLLRENYRILTASNGQSAIQVMEKEMIALIICDLRMPNMNGIQVLKTAQLIQADAIRIILTGQNDLDSVLQAVNIGQASQIILKPWEDVLLIQTVKASMEKHRLIKENKELHALTLAQHKDLRETHDVLRHELLVGAKIHETLLLGRVPCDIPELSLELLSIPAKEIGGDFFEFYRPASQMLDVVIGDVMGKGIPAALVGTSIKTHLLHFAVPLSHSQIYKKEEGWIEDILTPQEILEHLHDELVSKLIQLEYFATLFYGRFDLEHHFLTYVDCGSTKPIHYKANEKKTVYLTGNNFPLGAVEQENYQSFQTSFSEKDIFIFYSDGLTEAKSIQNEMYGYERLAEIVDKNVQASPSDMINLIKNSIIDFTKNTLFEDDLTIIIIKINQIDWIQKSKLMATKFQADLSELSNLRKFVDCLCQSAPLNGKNLSCELQLAINEAFCNIVKHGYHGNKEGSILVQGKLQENGVTIELSDQGIGFNPKTVQEPSLAGDQENGYGWFMIKEIADEVHYLQKESKQGWNHMHIYKKYPREGKKIQFLHAQENNVLIITPEGESLDAHDAPEFKEKVIDLIETQSLNRVVFDLHQLQFIDSSGLGSFLSVLRVLHSHGGELKLACMNKPVRTLFELVSMHKIFEIFNTKEEAIKSF
jgi:anti-anti-sigma factor